jgi:hypothetical protein
LRLLREAGAPSWIGRHRLLSQAARLTGSPWQLGGLSASHEASAFGSTRGLKSKLFASAFLSARTPAFNQPECQFDQSCNEDSNAEDNELSYAAPPLPNCESAASVAATERKRDRQSRARRNVGRAGHCRKPNSPTKKHSRQRCAVRPLVEYDLSPSYRLGVRDFVLAFPISRNRIGSVRKFFALVALRLSHEPPACVGYGEARTPFQRLGAPKGLHGRCRRRCE